MGELLEFPGGARTRGPATRVGASGSDPALDSEGFASIERDALRALARRGLSRRELEQRLARRGHPPEAVAAEADRLEAVGLVDDLALARHLVARLREGKRASTAAIRAELTRRALAPEAIAAVSEELDGVDDLANATLAAERRLRQYAGLDPATATRRLAAFLQRRGYTSATVRAVLDSLLAR